MRRRWVAGLLLSAAALPITRAAAQDTRELARRVDVAVSLQKSATAALDAYRRERAKSRIYPDTVAMVDGAFLVITEHEFLPIVRAAAASADSFVRQRAGSQGSLLRGTMLAVRTDSQQRAQHAVIISQRFGASENNARNVNADAPSVARMFEEHALWVLGTKDKPNLARWLTSGLPIDTTTKSDWRAVRLELVSARATVAHRCYGGDIEACKATLGLIDEPDPVAAWYDSAGRRALVDAARKSGQLGQYTASGCLAGNDTNCITLMRGSAALIQWSSPPGSGRARIALAQQAFAMGGPGALERLMTSKDSIARGLSAVAGAPIDSVIARWQRHAHDGGIESETATPVIALVAVGWILVMGALSLRSPRWR